MRRIDGDLRRPREERELPLPDPKRRPEGDIVGVGPDGERSGPSDGPFVDPNWIENREPLPPIPPRDRGRGPQH